MSNDPDPFGSPIDPALLRGLTQRRISRRDLMRYAGKGAGAAGLAAFLAACGVSGTTKTGPSGKKASPPSFDWSKQTKAGTLNFDNWPYYIDYDAGHRPSIEMFTSDTGINVTYRAVIQDNSSFLPKVEPALRAGQDPGFDLMVITNGIYLTPLIDNGWLIPLDHSRMTNFDQYASDSAKNPTYDPGNKYTMAWQSGITGIGYDPRETGRDITSFNDLFDSNFKGKVGMFGDNLDLPNATLVGMGVDPAKSTPDDWQAAADKLIKQRDDGIVRQYYDQSYINALENGDTIITQAWSGDIFQANLLGYPRLKFVVPAEGGVLWTDNMCIPAHAAHPLDAMIYMDYVYQPKVAALIADWVNYITPVPAAKDIILHDLEDPTVANSPLVFPDAATLASNFRYRVLTSDELKQWNSIFQPVYQA